MHLGHQAVVTSWGTVGTGGTYQLKLKVGSSGIDWAVPRYESELQTVSGPGPQEFPSRVRIFNAEDIGIYTPTGAPGMAIPYDEPELEGASVVWHSGDLKLPESAALSEDWDRSACNKLDPRPLPPQPDGDDRARPRRRRMGRRDPGQVPGGDGRIRRLPRSPGHAREADEGQGAQGQEAGQVQEGLRAGQGEGQAQGQGRPRQERQAEEEDRLQAGEEEGQGSQGQGPRASRSRTAESAPARNRDLEIQESAAARARSIAASSCGSGASGTSSSIGSAARLGRRPASASTVARVQKGMWSTL